MTLEAPERPIGSGKTKQLDRAQQLDDSLRGLSQETRGPALSALHKLHTQLNPTADELAERQQAYLGLLDHATEHVVGFALKMLAGLDRHGRLDAEKFIGAAKPVFGLRYKSRPVAALRLLKHAIDRRPDLVTQAAAVATEALTHRSTDVQEQALELLEAWQVHCGPALAENLAAKLQGLDPGLRPRAEALSRAEESGSACPDEACDTEPVPDMLTAPQEEATTIAPADGPSSVVLDQQSSTAWYELPAPLRFDVADMPVLSGVAAVIPLDSVDALFDAVARALDEVHTADEIERLLDGVSRLCSLSSADFRRRAASLLNQIGDVFGSGTGTGLISSNGSTSWVLRDLLVIWLTGGHQPTATSRYFQRPGPIPFFEARVRELTRRVANRRAAPLLAAPSHAGGWIAPLSLVERLAALEIEGTLAPRFDLTQALLRLAPQARAPALSAAALLRSPAARVVRFALGDDEGPSVLDQADAPLWLAAARARWPASSAAEPLAALRLPVSGPDLLEPARYLWRNDAKEPDRQETHLLSEAVNLKPDPDVPLAAAGESEPLPPLCLDPPDEGGKGIRSRVSSTLRQLGQRLQRAVVPADRSRDPQRDYPTLALHHMTTQGLHGGAPWIVHLGALVWPLNTDSYFAAGVRAMTRSHGGDTAPTTSPCPYLYPLFEPDRPLTETAMLALWLGLSNENSDTRELAVTVLVRTIEDGRAHFEALANVLSGIGENGWLKPEPLAESLRAAGRVSALHRLVVAQILRSYLDGLDALHADARGLLELVVELSAELQRPLTRAPAAVLDAAEGKGRTAELAKLLMEGPASLNPVSSSKVLGIAWAGRLARAARWQRARR
ncbi:MAG: DUF6493 family protein [Gammaproteobacteria bacterium]|nr:DUF6493 family protein [Gammaproteobacteria bacterium]